MEKPNQDMINHFYTYHTHLLVFESKKAAEKHVLATEGAEFEWMRGLLYASHKNLQTAKRSAHMWTIELKSKVTYTTPNEPILLLSYITPESFDGDYWHVIVGERVGWIIAYGWLHMKLLEKQNGK